MKKETITTIVLKASKGRVLTDGVVYGKVIYLATGRNPDEFTEITNAEYQKRLEETEEDGLA